MIPNYIEYQTISLELIKVRASRFLSGHALQSLRLEEITDLVTHNLCYELETYIASEKKLDTIPVVFKYNEPASFLDYLLTYAPKVVQKRFPPRYIEKIYTKHVDLTQYAMYPKLPYVFPENECGPVFIHWDAKIR